MNLNKEITLLLVIYNRPEYSLKWINNSIKNKIPFNIIIADAGNDIKLARFVKKKNQKMQKYKIFKM